MCKYMQKAWLLYPRRAVPLFRSSRGLHQNQWRSKSQGLGNSRTRSSQIENEKRVSQHLKTQICVLKQECSRENSSCTILCILQWLIYSHSTEWCCLQVGQSLPTPIQESHFDSRKKLLEVKDNYKRMWQTEWNWNWMDEKKKKTPEGCNLNGNIT